MTRKGRGNPKESQNPTIAIGYVRVSTEGQALEGVSLDAQRDRIMAYCEAHGLELASIEADEGVSGKRADNRPGLQRALEAVCEARGVLVTYSLSRLARSTKDAIAIAESLEKRGANLASLSERIDTTTAMGKFFFTTVAALAQLERDQIAERTSAALAYKRAQGQKTGGYVPYGFDAGPDGRLTPNEPEQSAIARMQRLRSRGKSLRQIAADLEAQGIKPKRGERWHAKTVQSALRSI